MKKFFPTSSDYDNDISNKKLGIKSNNYITFNINWLLKNKYLN